MQARIVIEHAGEDKLLVLSQQHEGVNCDGPHQPCDHLWEEVANLLFTNLPHGAWLTMLEELKRLEHLMLVDNYSQSIPRIGLTPEE